MNVSKILKQDFASTQTGTPYYASPEVWRDEDYNAKADIWSLGCVIFELCNLKQPFQASGLDRLFKKVQKKIIEKFERGYSAELQQAVHECLTLDYMRRPCAEKMMKNKIFDEVKAELQEEERKKIRDEKRWEKNSHDKSISRDSSGDRIIRMKKRNRKIWGRVVRDQDSGSEPMQSIMETIPVDLDFKSLAQRLPKARYSLSTDKVKTRETFEHKRSKSGIARRKPVTRNREITNPTPLDIKERMREMKRQRMKIVEQSRKKIQDKRRKLGAKRDHKIQKLKRLSIASGVSIKSGEGIKVNDARRRKKHLEMLKALGGGQGMDIGKSLMRERQEQERILSKLEICHSQFIKRDSTRHQNIKKKHLKTEGQQQINRIATNESKEYNKPKSQNCHKQKNQFSSDPKTDPTETHKRTIDRNIDIESCKNGIPQQNKRSPSISNPSRHYIETKFKMIKEEVKNEMSLKRKDRTDKLEIEGPTTKTRKNDSVEANKGKESLIMVNHHKHRELVRKLFDNSGSQLLDNEKKKHRQTQKEKNGYLVKKPQIESENGKENVRHQKNSDNPKDWNNRYNQVQINHRYFEKINEDNQVFEIDITNPDSSQKNWEQNDLTHFIPPQKNMQKTESKTSKNPNHLKIIKNNHDLGKQRKKKKMMKIAGLKLELNNSYNLLRPVGNTARGRIRDAVRGEGTLFLANKPQVKQETPTENNNKMISPEESEEKQEDHQQKKFYVDKISYTFSKKEKKVDRIAEKIEKMEIDGIENVNISNERKYQSQKNKSEKIDQQRGYLSQNRKASNQTQKNSQNLAKNQVKNRSQDRTSQNSQNQKNHNPIKPENQETQQNRRLQSNFGQEVDEYNFKGGLPRVQTDVNKMPELVLEKGNVVLKENSKNEKFLTLMELERKNTVDSNNPKKSGKSKPNKRKKLLKSRDILQNHKKLANQGASKKEKNLRNGNSANELKRLHKKRNSKIETKGAKKGIRNDSVVLKPIEKKKSVNKVLRQKKKSINLKNDKTREKSGSGHLRTISANESSKISRNSKSTSVTSALQNERRKNFRKHKMLIQRLNTIETSGTGVYSKKGRLSRPAGQTKLNKSRGGKHKIKRAGSDRPIGQTGRNAKKAKVKTLSICDQIDNIIDSSQLMMGSRTPKNYASKKAVSRHNNLSKKIGQTFKNLNSRSGIHKNINSWQNKSNHQLCLNLPSAHSKPNLPGPLSIYSRRAKEYKPDFQSSLNRVGRQAFTSKAQKDPRHFIPFKQYIPEKISKNQRLAGSKRGGSSRIEPKTGRGIKMSGRGNKIPKSTRNLERKKGKPKSLSQLGKSGTQRIKVSKKTSNYQFPSSYTLQTLGNGSQLYNLPSIPSIPTSYLSKAEAALYEKPNPKHKQKKMIQGPSTGAMESLVHRKFDEKDGYSSQIQSGNLTGQNPDKLLAEKKKTSILTQKLGSLAVGKGTRTPKHLTNKGTPKTGSFSTRHLMSLQNKYHSKFKSHMNISQKIKPISLFKNKDFHGGRTNTRNSNLASQIEARTQFKAKKGRSPRNANLVKKAKAKDKKGIFMDKSFMESLMQNGPSMNLSSKFLNSRHSNHARNRILK